MGTITFSTAEHIKFLYHYHWLVRQNGDIAAGHLPQRVFNAYSHGFNRRRNHSGTLLEGPYKVIQVSTDEYLHRLCRYIHANPVRHGFALDPSLWTYSNYLDWIGERSGTLIDRQFVSEHFGTPNQYKAYMMSYLTKTVVLSSGLEDYLKELDDAK